MTSLEGVRSYPTSNPGPADRSPFIPAQLKDELKDVKEVNSDTAASVYIEAFALKVFNNADAEDRIGASNRYASDFSIELDLMSVGSSPDRRQKSSLRRVCFSTC